MFILGIGLLGSIFLSFGCLIAAFKSLGSLARENYSHEARLAAITGFVFGLLLSVFFGWSTIVLLEKLQQFNQGMGLSP